MLLSIAPSILLTRPAALAVTAYVIAHGGPMTTLTYPNPGMLYHVMHGGRLLGTPKARLPDEFAVPSPLQAIQAFLATAM